jgi:hypothetical protein
MVILHWLLSLTSLGLAFSFAEAMRRGAPLRAHIAKILVSAVLVAVAVALDLA